MVGLVPRSIGESERLVESFGVAAKEQTTSYTVHTCSLPRGMRPFSRSLSSEHRQNVGRDPSASYEYAPRTFFVLQIEEPGGGHGAPRLVAVAFTRSEMTQSCARAQLQGSKQQMHVE